MKRKKNIKKKATFSLITVGTLLQCVYYYNFNILIELVMIQSAICCVEENIYNKLIFYSQQQEERLCPEENKPTQKPTTVRIQYQVCSPIIIRLSKVILTSLITTTWYRDFKTQTQHEIGEMTRQPKSYPLHLNKQSRRSSS